MRSRTHAAVVALLGSWFPLISPAAVGLVTLRQGTRDGSLLLLWAVLPALGALVIGHVGLLMPMITIAGVIAVLAASWLLRQSISWVPALMALVFVSGSSALLVAVLVPQPAQELAEVAGVKLSQSGSDADLKVFILGWVATALAISSLASLVLARWWQAMLYNPGGFQQEFQGIRLGMKEVLICMATSGYCIARGQGYEAWGMLLLLPAIIAGIAFVHFMVQHRKLGTPWLVIFYVMLILTFPLSALILAIIALTDTWFDWRKRLGAS